MEVLTKTFYHRNQENGTWRFLTQRNNKLIVCSRYNNNLSTRLGWTRYWAWAGEKRRQKVILLQSAVLTLRTLQVAALSRKTKWIIRFLLYFLLKIDFLLLIKQPQVTRGGGGEKFKKRRNNKSRGFYKGRAGSPHFQNLGFRGRQINVSCNSEWISAIGFVTPLILVARIRGRSVHTWPPNC